MSPQRDAGQLIVDALVAEGVTHVFGLGGGHINPTWWAAPGAGLRIVDVRHEAAAVYGAHGWALATGEPGVCLVTAGPGVTNVVTGSRPALHDGVPLVCLAGAATSRGEDLGEVEHLDQLDVGDPSRSGRGASSTSSGSPRRSRAPFAAATADARAPCTWRSPSTSPTHRRHRSRPRRRSVAVARAPRRRSARRAGDGRRAPPRRATPGRGGGKRRVVVARRCRRTPGLRRRDRHARGHPPGRAGHRARRPSLSMGRDWQQVVAQADVLLVVGSRMNYFFGTARSAISTRSSRSTSTPRSSAVPRAARPRRRRRRGRVPPPAGRRSSARSTSATGVPACERSATRSPRPRRALPRRTRRRCTRSASAPRSPDAFPTAPP